MAVLATSLSIFRAEINRRWPNRDTRSDGWIGDEAHQSTVSDHNPNERDRVDAYDVDKDGVDMDVIIAAAKRHPSVRYIIWQRKLYHRLRGYKAEDYNGPSAHDEHAHFSIEQAVWAENDTRSWGIATGPSIQGDTLIGLTKGDEGPEVEGLQRALESIGIDVGEIDRKYGNKVAAGVLAMRKRQGSNATDGNTLTPSAWVQLMISMNQYHGKPGPAGKTGATGATGARGPAGPPGTLPATVTITGTATINT